MSEARVRRATASDAVAVAGLLTQLGYPAEGADLPARMERLRGSGRADVFVAEIEGKVVGLATALIVSPINRVRDVVWLTTLVVDESLRGTGVGRSLVRTVEEFGRAAGCERVSVTTQEKRADAHAFYSRIGYEHNGRRFGKVLAP